MNRTLLLLTIAVVPALIAGAVGYGIGRLSPRNEASSPVTALGTIVGRVMELKVNGDDTWQTVEPRGAAIVTAADLEKAITTAQSAGTNFILNARYRLTIRDATAAVPYDVEVRGSCFDLVGVGGPWPPNRVDAC